MGRQIVQYLIFVCRILPQFPNVENHCLICRQFHQRFMGAFFVQNFGAKNYKAVFLPKRNWRKAERALLYEKNVRKMLMKLTPEHLQSSGSEKFFLIRKKQVEQKRGTCLLFR